MGCARMSGGDRSGAGPVADLIAGYRSGAMLWGPAIGCVPPITVHWP